MSQIISLNADLYNGAVEVANLKNVELSIQNEKIKDYDMDSTDPAVLEYGNMTYIIKAERGYTTKDILLTQIAAKTKLQLHVRPEGTGVGNEEFSLTDVVLDSYTVRFDRNTVVLENISGEGKSLNTDDQAA